MTDSALLSLGHRGTAVARAAGSRPFPGGGLPASGLEGAGSEEHTLSDRLWCEHGWSLGGTAVAVVVSLVVLASCAVHLIG